MNRPHWLRPWSAFRALTSRRRTSPAARPAPRRLCLETLEDRTLLAFVGPTNYHISYNPTHIVAADFRGTGTTDLATSSYGSNSASVLLGNGDGTFQGSVNYPAGSSPQGIATGDFNGDGKADLVLSDNSGSNVTILLSNGDGTFASGNTYATGPFPQSVIVADFNKDGKLDIAVADTGGNTVSVLLGNGDGTFQTARAFSCNDNPNSITVGDFYGDGHLSIAVSNGNINQVNILRGNGDGTFQAPAAISVGNQPISVAAADLNRDGHADLVVANFSANDVQVLLNKGNGTFSAPTAYNTDAGPHGIAIADFNGDGGLDLAVCNFNSGTVSVLLGHGDGAFSPQLSFNTASGSTIITVGDFNRDGHPDLATSNFYDSSVSVLLNDGSWPQVGSFDISGPTQALAGQSFAVTLTARDLMGNLDTSYMGTVHLASSDPRGILPPAYTFTAADHGQHTFNVTLTTAGIQSVSASDSTSNFSGTLSGISVSPAAVAGFTFAGLPSSLTAGAIQTFAAAAVDAFGNAVTNYVGTVHFASSDPRASLPGDYTFTTADHGSHSFAVVLRTAGSQSVTITDTSSGFSFTQAGIGVQAAAATSFVVAGFPATTAGNTGTFTVTAQDAYGNTATGYSGTVHLSSSDGQAPLPSDYTFTSSDQGTHLFGAVLYTAGTQSLTATDTASPAIAGTQAGILVSAAALSALHITGFPASAVAGTAQTFVVSATDAYGNAVSSYRGKVHFLSTDPKAALPADYTFTAADKGRHSFGAVLYTAGTQTLTAKDVAVPSLAGTHAGIDVVAGSAKVLRITGLPSSARVGQVVTFTVTLYDAYGNVATGYAGKVHFASSDGSSTLPANYTFTAQDAGSRTFSAVFRKKGKQSLTVSDTSNSHLKETDSLQVVS